MTVYLKAFLFIVNLSFVCLGLELPGYEFHSEVQGYLKLYREPADQLAARLICRDEGAVLAAPWSPEFTAVVNALQVPDDEEITMPLLLSGAVEIFPDGVLTRYSKRLPGALMNVQRCVAFSADGDTVDVDCEDKLPYVCFVPITNVSSSNTTTTSTTTASPTTSTTTPSPTATTIGPTTEFSITCATRGYVYSHSTGKCYKFHTKAKLWEDAQKTCEVEGGNLAVINSVAEAQFLSELYENIPDSDIEDAKYTHFAAIGIYQNKFRVWKTVDGFNLSDAGYSNWRVGEPKTTERVKNMAGFMYRDASLISFYGVWKTAFICEKEI